MAGDYAGLQHMLTNEIFQHISHLKNMYFITPTLGFIFMQFISVRHYCSQRPLDFVKTWSTFKSWKQVEVLSVKFNPVFDDFIKQLLMKKKSEYAKRLCFRNN